MVTIRQEQPEDIAGVHALNEIAFAPRTRLEKEIGQSAEAGIVDSIRSACPDVVSLVAVDAGRIVGHIFFSPAFVSTVGGAVQGIDALRERGCPFIIVLGHPEYYPRFGFVPASQHDLSCQWDGVPDEAFMVLVLDEDTMSSVSGVARYRGEFDQAM